MRFATLTKLRNKMAFGDTRRYVIYKLSYTTNIGIHPTNYVCFLRHNTDNDSIYSYACRSDGGYITTYNPAHAGVDTTEKAVALFGCIVRCGERKL